MQLLGSIPTAWDTTIVLQASVGDNIVTARRKNNEWFIGGMCAAQAKDVVLDLSFLSGGNYMMTVCKDGINADRNAMDYAFDHINVDRSSDIKIHLAPNGGFLIRLQKE